MRKINIMLSRASLIVLFSLVTCFAQTVKADVAQIVILETQYSADLVSKDSTSLLLTALVKVKNNAASDASSITIEAKFLNSQGKVLDAITDTQYSVTLASGNDVILKLKDQSSIKKEDIAKVEARIVSANFRENKSNSMASTNKKSALLEFVISWGPMLLFIGVWIWLMRRYSKGFQSEVLEQMKLQTAIIERQAIATEKIAAMQNVKSE
jgi:ATP-dependent Zn protease